MVVFGDSNVDDGNLFRLTGDKVPAAPNWRGRNSNGPNVAEYVARGLGAKLQNYGVSGATSGPTNVVGRLPAYKSIEITGMRWQVDQFLQKDKGSLGAADVVILWAGSNDILGLDRKNTPVLKAAVSQATGNTSSEIDRLLDVGARRILVANRTPREALENDNDLNGIDLNRALAATAAEAAKRSGADIRVFDAYASVAEMMRNPSRFGFEQVNALCIQLPACANETYESGLKTANAYVNWDAAHKTTRVHQLLADRMLGMLKP